VSLHKEISLEAEVCDWLGAHGWLYESSDWERYDRARAIFPPDLVAWVQAAQPKASEALSNSHGASAANVLLDRVRKQLDDLGTLDVLRHGVEMIGLKQQAALAQFRPALAMNADIIARYDANRLRVVRQVRYSTANENCIDLVLFLNGLPVATVELKTDFTQSVQDAVDQYRFDRPPHPKGQNREPLLAFASGAIVHFAVSNTEVAMTTRLEGGATRFLPFNKAMTAARATRRTRPAIRRATFGRTCGSARAGSKSSAATSSRPASAPPCSRKGRDINI
jgi:type I restriction enzyme, R subunit